jgi:hypothetical protein
MGIPPPPPAGTPALAAQQVPYHYMRKEPGGSGGGGGSRQCFGFGIQSGQPADPFPDWESRSDPEPARPKLAP